MPTSRRLLLTAPGSSPRAGVLICGRRARCHGCRDSVRPPLIPAHPCSSPIIPAHPRSSLLIPRSSPVIPDHRCSSMAHPSIIPDHPCASPLIPGPVDSPASNGVAGASLGLGRVEYEEDRAKTAPTPPSESLHSLQPPLAAVSARAPVAPGAPVPALNLQPAPTAARPIPGVLGSAPSNGAPQSQTVMSGAEKSSGTGVGGMAVPVVVVPLPAKWKDARIKTIVYGTIAHAPRFGDMELLEDAVVLVGGAGQILLVATEETKGEGEMLAWAQRFKAGTCTPVVQSEVERANNGGQHMDVISMARGQVLVPGFIDTHIHAPQYPYTGTATDKPLMEWLNQYTFPAEQRLSDDNIAARVYNTVVDRTLRGGTTTALYFATIHVRASKILADIALRKGQRAFIGKVCMDRNSPAEYSETTAQALEGTEHFIQYVRGMRTELVQPVITPRFIPTCTPELLEGLGHLARKYDCHVQSHISESHDEMQFVSDLHPNEGSDADIFDKHGLLTAKCVMAHGVHLNRDDADLLRSRGTAVAHCPLSNFFFGDGVLATAKLVAMGNKVGLGTDVAGGYCPCMLSSIRNVVIADRAVRQGGRHSLETLAASHETGRHRSAAILASGAAHKRNLADMPAKMDWRHAFHLATVGGARALGIDSQVGTIEVGKSFDALLLEVAGGGIDVLDSETKRDIVEKLLNLGTEHNVSKVWVNGRSVHHKPINRGPQRQRPSPRLSAIHPGSSQTPASQPKGTPAHARHQPGALASGTPVPSKTLGLAEPSPAGREEHHPSQLLPAIPATRYSSPALLLAATSSKGEQLAAHTAASSSSVAPAAPPLSTAWPEPSTEAPSSKYDSAGSKHAASAPQSPDDPPEPQSSPPRPLEGEEGNSDTDRSDDMEDSSMLEHSFSETEDDVGAC